MDSFEMKYILPLKVLGPLERLQQQYQAVQTMASYFETNQELLLSRSRKEKQI